MPDKNGEFKLRGGHWIRLHSLEQYFVYAGVLEGLPTRKQNDATIEHLRKAARDRDRREPVLFDPVQTPIASATPYPFGEPASLLIIACVGRFHSSQPARDRTMDCSDLTVIWFQEEYAFPLAKPIEERILAMDWSSLAHDRQY